VPEIGLVVAGDAAYNDVHQYLAESDRDFDRLDKETTTAGELYRQMLAIHPRRVNPGALWLSAQSAKPRTGRR
jgi:hypothetical protein